MESLYFTLGRSPIIDGLKSINTITLEPKKFSDGEFFVKIPVNVRNKQCYLIVDMTPDNIFQVLITIDTLKKACASKVTLVAPYLPYCRQDRRVDIRTPMSAKVLASMLETAGVDHIITMDVHALQIECFYNVPFDNLQGSSLLIRKILEDDQKTVHIKDTSKNTIHWKISRNNTVLVAPDAGAAKRTRFLAEKFGFQVVLLDKKRISDTEVKSYLIGDVKGKNCLMLDDMISSGGTIITGAKVLKENGADNVLAGCIHMLASEENISRLSNSDIHRVYSLNTRNVPMEYKHSLYDNIRVVDASSIFIDAITRDSSGLSVSSMFNQDLV